ncbi:MAG: hypothetical protein JWR69_4032 [Pedosphaera sp.]|nr:hypothetical protein [Pedosphaera sp.]
MSKPRVFVSSTYYDLKHIRASLENFIEGFGYEPVLFESGDIPFHHEAPLDVSCYAEITNCHMLVLIIGGRYGSWASDQTLKRSEADDLVVKSVNSVTKKEYETARKQDIPIFIFLDKNVSAEYRTFKENRNNGTIKYAHVDNVNIFFLLDDILVQQRNNFIKDFEKLSDITSWLRDQWSGLFADFLARRTQTTQILTLSNQVHQLGELTGVLKEYVESIIKKLEPENSAQIISAQQKKLVESRIKDFALEPMIHFIMVNAPDKSPAALYDAFVKSGSLDEFIKFAGLPKAVADSMREAGDMAVDDYNSISGRFLSP